MTVYLRKENCPLGYEGSDEGSEEGREGEKWKDKKCGGLQQGEGEK